MNRFEWINGEVYWRSGPDTVHPIRRGPIERTQMNMDEYPGLGEFLDTYAEELDYGMFELHAFYFYTPASPLHVSYRSTFVTSIMADVRINTHTNEKSICYITCEHCEAMVFNKEHDKMNYFAACKNIREAHARVAQLEAEIAELRAEIEHLHYRPGGPGYEEAAEHFRAHQ